MPYNHQSEYNRFLAEWEKTFKNANNAWYDLFDDSKFEQFIEKCMVTIETVLEMRK